MYGASSTPHSSGRAASSATSHSLSSLSLSLPLSSSLPLSLSSPSAAALSPAAAFGGGFGLAARAPAGFAPAAGERKRDASTTVTAPTKNDTKQGIQIGEPGARAAMV